MTHRDPSWRIVASYETDEHNRCVDIFSRLDGSYGFEEYRRDPEDMGVWTDVAYFSEFRFASQSEAETEAQRIVPWFQQR